MTLSRAESGVAEVRMGARYFFFAGFAVWVASTETLIPPREANSPCTVMVLGAQAVTRSSRIRFATSSLKERWLRYEAK